MNYHSIKDLCSELEDALTNFNDYHSQMSKMLNYYKFSAFYTRKSGGAAGDGFKANMLKVFADKNIHYSSREPIIKVPTTGSSPEQRQTASIREKIIYATRRYSGTPQLRKKWAFDGTIFSAAVAETGFDLKKRCAFVKRYDPRYCFWQMSNENENRVGAFWAVYPITADECEKRYGKRPKVDLLAKAGVNEDFLRPIDGKQWFTLAIRWDDKVKVMWCGDIFIEVPHEHLQGGMPIDVCQPFQEGEQNWQGSFYLDPLVPLQAELNKVMMQRKAIAARMGNPTLWGRGINTRQKDDITSSLATVGGGMVGLKTNGELGLLQVNDTRMLKEHEDSIIAHMMRISGFGAATFGESVGANTSGDALGMYFTPTERLIENQNVSWNAFDESINSKILRAYDKFGKIGETFDLSGYSPAGTLLGISDSDSRMAYSSGGFDVKFDRTVISGNYTNICYPGEVTPKNEIANNEFWLQASQQGQISKTTFYEKIGILSPEDELELLKIEQAEPVLNPEGTSQILQTQTAMMTAQAQAQNPQLPTGQLPPPKTPQPLAA